MVKTQKNTGNDENTRENAENPEEIVKELLSNPEIRDLINKNPAIGSNLPMIVQMAVNNPAVRKDIIKYVKREFDFDLNSLMEMYFGEDPDKRIKLEDVDEPMRNIAESVIILKNEGWSPGQIASQLGLFPHAINEVLRDQAKWELQILEKTRRLMPWYIRIVPLRILKVVYNGS